MSPRLVLVVVVAITLLSASVPASEKCPVCHMPLIKTGQTRAEWGKILYEQKCVNSHVFWYPRSYSQKNEKQKNSSGDCDCPICGFHGHSTGNPKLKKCMNGHQFGCG